MIIYHNLKFTSLASGAFYDMQSTFTNITFTNEIHLLLFSRQTLNCIFCYLSFFEHVHSTKKLSSPKGLVPFEMNTMTSLVSERLVVRTGTTDYETHFSIITISCLKYKINKRSTL